MKSGDKIKFGAEYCEKTGRHHYLNQTVMLTPQYFEGENGEEEECPGIYDEVEMEMSIYHLFGDNLERFCDCELMPATEEDLTYVQTLRREVELELEVDEDFISLHSKQTENKKDDSANSIDVDAELEA